MAEEAGEGHCCRGMKAVLKRRWILMSCAGVLLACSVCDLAYIFDREVDGGNFVMHTKEARLEYLCKGNFYYPPNETRGRFVITDRAFVLPNMPRITTQHQRWHVQLQMPKLGTALHVGRRSPAGFALRIPLWLPLSVVLGWIVWRELRWRERRARATAATE
jgi:hypothetical protein